MAKLEVELAKAVEYTKLAWQLERTYNSQVTLVTTFKEIQQKDIELNETFAEQIHSEISSVHRNLRDLIDAIAKDFLNERATRGKDINKLKSEMIILMERALEANFMRRVPTSLLPVQAQIENVQNQLDFTSQSTDERISSLEKEVAQLKKQHAQTVDILVAYAQRLDQLDQSHATLNTTVSDPLSLSPPTLIVDAKKGKR